MRARGGSGPRAAPLRVFAATWLRRVEKPETRRSWPPDSGRDAGSAGAPRRPLSRSLGQRGGGDEAARGQQNNFDAQFDLTRSPRSPSPKPLSLPGSGGTAPERTSRAVGAPGRGIPCGPAGAPAPWLRLPRPPVCAPPRRPPPARRGAPRPALPSGPRAPPAGGVTPSATAGSVHGSNRKSLSPDHRQHRGLRGSQTCACSPSEAHMQTRAGKAGFLGLFQPCQMLAPADEPGQVRREERGRWGRSRCAGQLPGEHPPSGACVSAPAPSLLQRVGCCPRRGSWAGPKRLTTGVTTIPSPPSHIPGLEPGPCTAPSSPCLTKLAPSQRLADQVKTNHIDGLFSRVYSDSTPNLAAL
ncbi:uncharacterized protein LOC123613928 [Camelus bactrianus]|uniref:Uncharacterized protein LOC123613928 n=1 Tax=Camelus bactrianus TaxID=9837 RepID=A0AC58P4Q9_CAMBA